MKNFCYKCLGLILFGIMMWVPGVNAQRYWNVAAQFDGTAQSYIEVAPYYSLKYLSGSFTVECWFNSASTNTSTLFGKTGFRLLLESAGTNKVRGRMQTGNNTKLYSRAAGMDLNKWYHLACTYDSTGSGTMRFYINGGFDTSTTGMGYGAYPGTDSLFIGNSIYGAFKGMIDDIRVWDRPLSQTEIMNNMRNPYVGPIGASSSNFGNGCVMTSPFDFTYAGGGNQLYFYDGFNNYIVNKATPYYLGDHPSQTLAINSSLDLTNGGYAAMGTNADIELAGPMSMEAWVYPTTSNSGTRYIIAKKAGWNDPGYGIYYDSISDGPRIRYKNNGTGNYSTSIVPTNKWTHIAATISQTGDSKIYINGQLDAETGIGIPSGNTDSLYIGNIKGGDPANGFIGYIDGVNVYNYERSQAEIQKSMFRITDYQDKPTPPNSAVSFNFDYNTYSSTGNGGWYYLKNNAKMSSPAISGNVPVSPLLGNNIFNFPSAYNIKSSNRRIPEFNTAGYMKEDSLQMTNTKLMSDVKLFIALNHERLNDLQIVLMAPTGDSVIVWDRQTGVNSYVENIVTVFDDNAPDNLISSKYVDFGPTIKPANPLNSVFAGKNPLGIWRLKITDFNNGATGFLYGWGLSIDNVSGVVGDIAGKIPIQYQLEQNYPNPFNPSTVIRYSIPYESSVKITVYNIVGQEVKELLNEIKSTGTYELNFNAKGLSSGVYFYMIQANSVDGKKNFNTSKKMMVLK